MGYNLHPVFIIDYLQAFSISQIQADLPSVAYIMFTDISLENERRR